MRERCLAGRQHSVGDAVGKVQPLLAWMKKLAEIGIIRRLKVSAICQIFYDHLSTTTLYLPLLILRLLLQEDFYTSIFDSHRIRRIDDQIIPMREN